MEVSRQPTAPGAGPTMLPRVPAPLAAPRPALPERLRRGWRRHWLDVALVVPLAAYILGFTLLPVLQSIALGFTARFSGAFPTLANYADIFARPDFGLAVLNTVGITVIGVVLELVVGLAIALMLAHTFPLRAAFRTLVLVPMGVPTLVAGAAMIYVVGVNGYLNELLF